MATPNAWGFSLGWELKNEKIGLGKGLMGI